MIERNKQNRQRELFRLMLADFINMNHELIRLADKSITHPKRAKQARQAQWKLRTIARCLLRELERNLSQEDKQKYAKELALFRRVIEQQRKNKDKVYSLHKLFTACISKGKVHRLYEFGNKVGMLVGAKSLVILGVKLFLEILTIVQR